ncbi:hypothetical protein H4W00_001002 [Psychrobacter sp. PL19]|uniref:integrase n=1 Tax=Psychrobacter sp. PL19 TaxID=2760711 RepID=UPI001AE88ED0
MSDNRSKRKTKVISFVTIKDDRDFNLNELVKVAKQLRLEGFEFVVWQDEEWRIIGGRLSNLTGTNNRQTVIKFRSAPKLGGELLSDKWLEVAKALFILRFHRKNQASSNQRNFITAISYISYAANSLNQSLYQLTPESLDKACEIISQDYADTTAYNLHKAVAEFAAHCDSNGLCRNFLGYKSSFMKRPQAVSGLNYKRLDDPKATETTESKKMAKPEIYKIIGELYLNVPREHNHRLYVLILSLLLLTGRRFSEISLLPLQKIAEDKDGKFYIQYFPGKSSFGDIYTPLEKLYLPTKIAPIIKDVVKEVIELTKSVRETAIEMQNVTGADLRFLDDIPEDSRFYWRDLNDLGLSSRLLEKRGWLGKSNYTWSGIKNNQKASYTNKEGLREYCSHYFEPKILDVIHIDQQGKKYYLEDLLFIRHPMASKKLHIHWLATSCTHSMISTFLRYFPKLTKEYASKSTSIEFTSHNFRHTMNTLLDEGGLSDLLQTEWFGRTNPRDTKAYQHTSPAKRALMLREDIKNGTIGGKLAEQIKVMPINHQDAVLKARIKAVHDVGTGLCIHNFSQMPCERHLQCSADCKDYVWIKDDSRRIEEVKRLFSLTTIAQATVKDQAKSKKPKKSSDWILHNEKKLQTLGKQLSDYGVESFDPSKYLKETYGV